MSPAPDLSSASDQEVVACACQGRDEGYHEILRRYQRRVFKRIYRLVHDHELAEDLTQDTFVKAFRALASHRPERKFSAWILKIASHTAIDHVRRKQLDTTPLRNTPAATPTRHIKPTALQLSAESAPTPARLDARHLGPAMQQAIRQLRTKYRRCITLRYVEERSYDDIAETLNLPLGTVKTYMHRGRNELKKMLGPLLDSPSGPACTPV